MEPAASPDDTTRLRDLVRGRIGLALPAGGPDLIRVVRRATEAAAVADAAALCELLRAGVLPGEPLDALIGALNISETHFFRDAGQMAALEKVVLPELIARRRPERRLRVWSAGCSTGEEPYTLAMLIHRLLPDLAGWDVLVLGTDINGRSLATAQRGRYRAWSLRGMPDRARAAYLRPAADAREEVQVAPEIHRMVTFRQLNLAGEAYPAITGGMDLVLCRNVLLYFDDAAARAVVRRLRRVLPDDGWLLLSQVEAGLADADGLVPTPIGAAFRCCPRAGTWAAPAPASPPPPVPALARSATPALVPVPVPVPVAAEAEALARPRALAAPEAGQPVAGVGEAVDEAAACGLAVELWRDGRHEAALAGLAAAAARDPLLPRPHYLLALILLDRGREAEALAAFRRCTYADPGFVPAHLGRASLLVRLGEHRHARIALEQAARLAAGRDPTEPIVAGADLKAAEVHELIASQRRLLADRHGRSPGRAR